MICIAVLSHTRTSVCGVHLDHVGSHEFERFCDAQKVNVRWICVFDNRAQQIHVVCIHQQCGVRTVVEIILAATTTTLNI